MCHVPPPPRTGQRALFVVFALLLAGVVGFFGWFAWLRTDGVNGSAGVGDADGPVWLQDVTEAVGLDFVHDPGPTGTYLMPQSMGSGCAIIREGEGEGEGDGTLYLYLLHHGGPQGKKNQLFKQLPDGTFKDVSQGSGLDIAGFNMGVAVGDVNNDGLPDVVVTQYGGVKLFLNQGGGRFQDVTEEAGLANPLWGCSAAFLDFNRDGWLDLIVVNYLDFDAKRECLTPQGAKEFCGPNSFSGTSSKLFRNRGPRPTGARARATVGNTAARVTFEDVSLASGIGLVPGPGLGVVCADFDGDGWPDIFVANDGKPNRLWINQHDGTFKDEAASRGVGYTAVGNAYAGMGIALGDAAGSGMFDLFVTHLGTETHTLWRQGPQHGQFRDTTAASGLTSSRWRGTGFGTLMADFDLDGSLDLAVVNGRVIRGGEARNTDLGFWEPYAERNQLFAGDGTGKFRDVSPANKPFCGGWNVGRGLVCADFDKSGAPGLLVTAIGSRARLFRNVAPNRGHWLKVRALDPKLKRDAYGAEVRVRAGNRTWLRLINPAQSYLSSSSALALFGLGNIDRVDSIEVTWPDGSAPEKFAGGAVDRMRVLRKGEASP
jgi:hypothetical protein